MRKFAVSAVGNRVGYLHPTQVATMALALCLLFTACGNSIQGTKATSSPISLTPPLHASYPNFHGIFQFRGEEDPANASSPYLAGANITFYWSQLEPAQGHYNWKLLDQAMQPWIAHGKKVILRISTSGWAHWEPPYSAQGTPQWVFNAGVPFVTEVDGALFPQYWHPLFLSNLGTFVHAMAQRYDANPHLAYIQIGVGVGGETKVDTEGKSNPNILQLWQHIGYTDAIWWNAVQKIITIYASAFHSTPLALMPDATFIGDTHGYQESLVLNYAVQHGIWLQDNGLQTDRLLPSIWMTSPHTEEQIAPASQTGASLQAEIQTALNLQARYILIFTADINNPANQQVLQWAAEFAS